MDYEDFAVVEQIRRKLDARAINISWPSSENLSSTSPRKSNRRGPGFQFAGQKLFDVDDGDETRHIDWNASASEPDEETFIVRTFRRPRVVKLSVFLDVNQSMNMGSKGTFKGLLAAAMAGCGIMSAKKVKDRASFVTYTHQPVSILKSQNASRLLTPALVHAVRDRQIDQDVSEAPAGGGLAASLRATYQKTRSIALVVSDFVNMNEDDWEALRLCGLRNETIAVFVQDRREKELPQVPYPGMQYTLEDLRGNELSIWLAPDDTPGWLLKIFARLFGSATTRSAYSENFKRFEAGILDRLQDCGVKTLVVTTDEEDDAIKRLLAMLANKLRM
jgi:uncharacterized protein (DUF58 family)